MEFVGRGPQMRQLDARFDEVRRTGRGLLVAVRGRRQVGKSTLYTEWLRRRRPPHVFFSAVKNAPVQVQLDQFRRDVSSATPPLPQADVLFASAPTSWNDLFGRLRLAATDEPVVVVLDEFPWAAEADATLEGELQNAWDRWLQGVPILLVLIGSDITMMERLTSHDRPLFGRAREERITPFNPAEVAAALPVLPPFDVFDAFLVTGGYPRLVDGVGRHGSVHAFVGNELSDENSDLAVMAQRSLDAEFPPDAQARRILGVVGADEVGWTTFSRVADELPELSPKAAETALVRALRLLVDDKRVLCVDVPAGAPSRSRLRRYRIADPYLRFWFRFVEPQLANVARGRGDLATDRFHAGFSAWRGVAIEPVVRDAVFRLAPDVAALGSDVAEIGPWWNRTNSVEVDLVALASDTVRAVGTIKWRARRPIDRSELRELERIRTVVPRASAASLVLICPAGASADASAALSDGASADASCVLTAVDLLAAWRS